MAKFEGNLDEFYTYVGPRITNRICAKTRSMKRKRDGVCQECEERHDQLDSAHIHGRERRTIILEVLQRNECIKDDVVIIPNIKQIEDEVLFEHIPLEDTIKFLCRQCHFEYDNNNLTSIHEEEIAEREVFITFEQEKNRDWIFRMFHELQQSDRLTSEILHNLCDNEFCKTEFNCNQSFPVLKKVENDIENQHQIMVGDHARFYTTPLDFNGDRYWVSNDWYWQDESRKNRLHFKDWCDSQLEN